MHQREADREARRVEEERTRVREMERVEAEVSAMGAADEGELGRNWIVYNKPRSRQQSHAGFLLGLGLQVYVWPFSSAQHEPSVRVTPSTRS